MTHIEKYLKYKNKYLKCKNEYIYINLIGGQSSLLGLQPSLFEGQSSLLQGDQFFNEQNYVYLETLFYKRALIHNSPLFKDVGYYYPEFNVNIGSDQLLAAIEDFDQLKHVESYEAKLEEVSIYNEKNQEKTRELIESVIK
jgi:hypothetical protein